MHRASCLCGDVTWQFDGPLGFMSHCHCSRCRKAHGTGFATYVAGSADSFHLEGKDQVARFEFQSFPARCFCRRCGSVVPGDVERGHVFAPAGNFLDDPGVRPRAHIFVASKAPWVEIHDELRRYDAYPADYDAPIVADRPPLDPPGKPRGSCLCGAVTYIVEGAPRRALNCHCSRCRRERSSAHGSNLFTSADGVRFTRGEDQLDSYKLPEAKFFTQVFCRTCGSPMPRIDRARDLAVVAMGSLDDDPGIRPQAHVFVASKAPWFEIPADGLPRHDEYLPSA
jgi:hypothetical protein